MALKNRRVLYWALALFLVTVALGTVQIIPLPVISVSWQQSNMDGVAPYKPAFMVDDNRELVLVYLGSQHCAASNDPELPRLVELLKNELRARATDANIGFSAIGVGIDWLPVDGWRHLAKFGAFDEIVVGRKWSGIGSRQFMKEEIAGMSATPQVLVYERRRTSNSIEAVAEWENVVLARKAGISKIQNWVDIGIPLRSVP